MSNGTWNFGLRARKIQLGGRRADTYGKGRVCTKNKCMTKLSKYNRKERCFAHRGPLPARLRGG